jgi:hypothetical protein
VGGFVLALAGLGIDGVLGGPGIDGLLGGLGVSQVKTSHPACSAVTRQLILDHLAAPA